jgi:hypothetical protein
MENQKRIGDHSTAGHLDVELATANQCTSGGVRRIYACGIDGHPATHITLEKDFSCEGGLTENEQR